MKKSKKIPTVSSLYRKLPKNVEVGPYTVPIIISEEADGHGCYGFTHTDEETDEPRIVISPNIRSAKTLVSTFLHELTHVVDKIGGHGFSEEKVEALGNAYTQALFGKFKF